MISIFRGHISVKHSVTLYGKSGVHICSGAEHEGIRHLTELQLPTP